jgi:DNA helicase IV
VSYASRTYEFEDKEDGDPDSSEVLSAHDIIDAERFAERHEEDDHRSAAERAAADRTWAFGHIIVDEAQELSPMAWRLLMRRCPSRSMTVVGDIAQTSASWGPRSWEAVLDQVVPGRWRKVELTVNYRTPIEIMSLAADVLHAVDPDAVPPQSVRETGEPPRAVATHPAELAATTATVAAKELVAADGGTVGVLAPDEVLDEVLAAVRAALPAETAGEPLEAPVSVLGVAAAKGLEFDAVVVVEPAIIVAAGSNGLRDLYVALTRATKQLTVVHALPLPAPLARLADGTG